MESIQSTQTSSELAKCAYALRKPDELFKSATQFAQRNQTTISALIEDGLRRVLSEQRAETETPFKLKDASVRGEAMLIKDPRRWHEMAEEHVISRVKKSLTNSA